MRFTTKTLNQRTENRGQRTVTRLPSSVFRLQGFTLTELVVAIGIMAVVILFAGNVFKTSISSYRIASAQAEIMQKFRAITDQLNNDFRGLRKDAPMFIWFQVDLNDVNNRLDQIMFFADGDFQSTRTYDTTVNPIVPAASGSPVVSNLARIYYGQAQSIDRVLSRRQHLSISNPDSPPLYYQFPAHDDLTGIIAVDPCLNDWFEHDTNSLSQWQVAALNGTNIDNIITGCFGTDIYFSNHRPQINLADANTLHLLMAQKVGNFSVQWSYLFTNAGQTYVYWWPSIDPDGNGNLADSDFVSMSSNAFGFYFNAVAPSLVTNWSSYNVATGFYYPAIKPVFPRALKFTFTLYDSRGVFKDGQTFTHIIYLGD